MKKLIALLLIVVVVIGTAGCVTENGEHEHNWGSFYVVNQPTCSKVGKLECICSICGEKKLEDLNKLGHSYNAAGVCSICGVEQGVINVPNDKEYGFSLKSVHEKFLSYGYTVDYETFIEELSYRTFSIEELSVNGDNLNCVVLYNGYEFPMTFADVKVDLTFDVEDEDVEEIIKLENKPYREKTWGSSDDLVGITKDGSLISIGDLCLNQGNVENICNLKIKSLAINEQDYIIVISENNKAKVIGKVTETTVANSTNLKYYTGNPYTVMAGFIEIGVIKDLVIPLSHRGELITRIGEYAFYKDQTLESVKIGGHITTIERAAFYSCPELKTVIIEDGVMAIGAAAFACCDKLTQIVLPESVCQVDVNAFYSVDANINVFCEHESEEDLQIYATNNSANVYYKNEWHYVDGVPTVK